MKIIFSRKGFDLQFGGFPSPILPEGRLVSLPIPNKRDDISYSELLLSERENYYDLMMSLKGKVKYSKTWYELKKSTKCHLDPDLCPRGRSAEARLETNFRSNRCRPDSFGKSRS